MSESRLEVLARPDVVEARALPDGRLVTVVEADGSRAVQITNFEDGRASGVDVFADEARGRAAAGLDPQGGAVARRNLEVVRGVFEGIAAAQAGRDPGGAFDAVADDLETVTAPEVPGTGTYHGLDGYAEFLRTWTGAFDRWSHRLVRAIAVGDHQVVGWGHQSGVGRGSGVPVDLDFGIVFELRDARLVRVRLFMQYAEALAEVGLG